MGRRKRTTRFRLIYRAGHPTVPAAVPRAAVLTIRDVLDRTSAPSPFYLCLGGAWARGPCGHADRAPHDRQAFDEPLLELGQRWP